MTQVQNIIQKPFVNAQRVDAIREALVNGYQNNDRIAVEKAAIEAQKYIADGGDIDYNIDEELEDYRGDDPDKMADKYLLRLLHDRHLDIDSDAKYIATGWPSPHHVIRCAGREFTFGEWCDYLKATNKDESERIVTTIGKYDFNDHDICLNPKVMSLVIDKVYYYVTLKWCYCGNGLWAFGMDYSTGNGGGGFGCAFVNVTGNHDSCHNGYKTEEECIMAACDCAISRIENTGRTNDSKVQRLLAMVKVSSDRVLAFFNSSVSAVQSSVSFSSGSSRKWVFSFQSWKERGS